MYVHAYLESSKNQFKFKMNVFQIITYSSAVRTIYNISMCYTNSVNYLVHLETLQVADCLSSLKVSWHLMDQYKFSMIMSRYPLESTLVNHNMECLAGCSSPCIIYQQLYCILRWIKPFFASHSEMAMSLYMYYKVKFIHLQ